MGGSIRNNANSASVKVEVEAEAELGNNWDILDVFWHWKKGKLSIAIRLLCYLLVVSCLIVMIMRIIAIVLS